MALKEQKPVIEVKNLNFHYNQNQVLEDINFTVDQGEYLGIIGPNGGGKTTLLKLILGLIKPSSGSIRILGQDLATFKGQAKIGYVPQRITESNFQFPATVEEIVKSGRTAQVGMFKNFSQTDYTAIKKAMEITDTLPYKNRLIGQLSGGERQRVFIARALAGEPKIIILDEPTVAIDIASQGKFYSFLGDLNKKLNLTVIIVSHDIDVVAKEVKTVLCLNRGLVCHGNPAELIKDQYLEKLYGKKVKFILHGH